YPDDALVRDYAAAGREAARLPGPALMGAFLLARTAPPVRDAERGGRGTRRDSYGGEFGRRCQLARRLVERGVRFVEVSHNLNFLNGTGWDTHNDGQLGPHLLIHALLLALAGFISDLTT